MKVLLYLTIALCVVAQAFAGNFTCSSANITSTNCGGIINSLLLSGTYSHFDLNQLIGFNVTAMDAGLTTIFTAISASPLCSQCQANLKTFFCLNIYPNCVTAINGTIASKPSLPCNDAACTNLSNSCIPAVFTPNNPLYNAAYVMNYGSLIYAFTGVASAFIAQTPTLFGLPSNSTAQCANQNTITTTLSALVGESLTCSPSVETSYASANPFESCPCMPFPSSGTTYCTKAAVGFGSIPAIYGAVNVTLVDEGIYASTLSQAALLPTCANCAMGLNIFACSTGFLQCNATTNAATAFQFPCESVGANFISSCSLQAAYNFATAPYNPQNATLNAQLLAVITAASSLPTTNCAYQPFTPDANCGCSPLASTDVCYAYISGVSPFIPAATLVTLNQVVINSLPSLMSTIALFNTSAGYCPNCMNRITSSLCNAVYPSCDPVTTAAAPHCLLSCELELAECGYAAVCLDYISLSSDLTVCAPYNSLVAPLNFGTNCNYTCVNLTASTLGVCAPYVNYPVSIFLNTSDIALGVELYLTDPDLMNLFAFSCPACAAAITQFICISAFPGCYPFPPIPFYPVDQSVCTDSLATCRADQYTSPDITALLSLVSALHLNFTAPNVSLILSTCEGLLVGGFIPPTYAPLAACPCGTIPASSMCAQYVSHPIGGFLANLPLATRATLEATILGFDVSVMYAGCPNCHGAVDFNLCNAAYPSCTTSQLAIRACESDCIANVGFCTDSADAIGVCTQLSALGAYSNSSCAPIPYSVNVCNNPPPPSGASSLMPSFFVFILAAMFAKILF